MCSPQLLHTSNVASGAEVLLASNVERTMRQLAGSLLVLNIRFFFFSTDLNASSLNGHVVYRVSWIHGIHEYRISPSSPLPCCSIPCVSASACVPLISMLKALMN